MIIPRLDPNFTPMIAAIKTYRLRVQNEPAENRQKVAIVAEREGGRRVCCYEALRDGVDDELNCRMAERMAKTVLWICGGYRLGVYGSDVLYSYLSSCYREGGARAFDADFMSGVFERPFEVVRLSSVPEESCVSRRVGGYTKGCRIGFDAGGSDRKVSAVIDGKAVYSEEVVWNPKTETDPHYHYEGILEAMKTAASKMPRVDSIGVSTAGVCLNNRAMVSSLFLKVDKSRYGDFVKDIYLNVAKEIGAPVEVANDGDVTALAGSMDLKDGCVLGIAMGTSEAAGYIDRNGGINGWLSELAFAPVDFNGTVRDEWSGDVGVGCKYFSQDAVARLAEAGGHVFRETLTPAEKLKEIRAMVEGGDPLAEQVYKDIGVYLGHTLPFYAQFYEMRHVLLLGRVMSGRGGNLVLESCLQVLKTNYPEFAAPELILPDESSRRVGQSIAAASLYPDK